MTSDRTPSPPAEPDTRLLRAVALVVFVGVIARAAWVGDDALATLRTVDNFVNGHGLVYNLGERVQSYTHPLWMFLLSAVYAVWSSAYWASILLGMACSTAAMVLVSRRLIPAGAAWWLFVPVLSRAYVDYSTSGLENPLTHLLFAGVLAVWFGARDPTTRLSWVAILGGLMVLNRMDTILLATPIVLASAWQAWRDGVPVGRVLVAILRGGLPFLAWEAFSLVYYGQLVPNTAIAKLSYEHARSEVLTQGGLYLLFQAEWDPVTLVVVFGGLATPLVHRDGRGGPVAAGTALYLAYLVWIGGDFMAGRFLTAAFLGSLVLLARVPLPDPGTRAALAAVLLAVGFSGIAPPLLPERDRPFGKIDPRGIADERWYYARIGASIHRVRNDSRDPEVSWRHAAVDLGHHGVKEDRSIGFVAMDARRDAYLFTRFGLTDPLLPRIPARYFPSWRVGHSEHITPEGYVDTLRTGKNRLKDPDLAALWDALAVVTRGPLFTAERWREIWRLNTGHYRISRPNDYRYPDAKVLDAYAPLPGPNRSLSSRGAVKAGVSGAVARLDGVTHADRIRIRRREDIDWRVIFEKDGRTVGTVDVGRDLPRKKRLGWETVRVPQSVVREGYDAVRAVVTWGAEPWTIQFIQVLDGQPHAPEPSDEDDVAEDEGHDAATGGTDEEPADAHDDEPADEGRYDDTDGR